MDGSGRFHDEILMLRMMMVMMILIRMVMITMIKIRMMLIRIMLISDIFRRHYGIVSEKDDISNSLRMVNVIPIEKNDA
jgi:hypothetical protein